MEFFSQLFAAADNLNLSIQVFKKNDKLTVQVLPNGTNTIKSVMMTGTPAELDEQFFATVVRAPEQTGMTVIETEEKSKEPADDKIETPKQEPPKTEVAATTEKPQRAKPGPKPKPKAQASATPAVVTPEPSVNTSAQEMNDMDGQGNLIPAEIVSNANTNPAAPANTDIVADGEANKDQLHPKDLEQLKLQEVAQQSGDVKPGEALVISDEHATGNIVADGSELLQTGGDLSDEQTDGPSQQLMFS